MSGSIIIWCLYQHTKCSCRVAKKIKNKFLRGVLTIFVLFFCLFVCLFVFFGDLGGVALKLEKANFFHFFLKFQSMSVTFHSCRPLQQTTRNSFNAYIIIVLNNKIGPLFWVTKRIKLQNSFTLSLKLVLHQGYSNSQALRHFS